MDSSAGNRVLTEAATWEGTPWRHQADIKGVGVDCAFFLVRVFHAAGLIPDIDPRPYPPDWHFHRDEERFLGWVQQYGDEVDAPEPGDVAVFKFGRCFSHGAIVVEWPRVIHSAINECVRYQDATTGRLEGRDVRFFRIRKG